MKSYRKAQCKHIWINVYADDSWTTHSSRKEADNDHAETAESEERYFPKTWEKTGHRVSRIKVLMQKGVWD